MRGLKPRPTICQLAAIDDRSAYVSHIADDLVEFAIGQLFTRDVRQKGLRLVPSFFEVGELITVFVVVLTLGIVDVEKSTGALWSRKRYKP